jgi:hypothetical protein
LCIIKSLEKLHHCSVTVSLHQGYGVAKEKLKF